MVDRRDGSHRPGRLVHNAWFLGDYKITVTVVGKEKSTLVKLTKPGTTTVITLD